MEEKTSNVMDSTSNIEYIMMQAACPEEEPYSSSDRCNESPPKKKNKKWYFQPFNREWLMDPKFKEWLTSDPNDKYVALCKVCDVKFRNSNKTALFRHRETQKHQKKLKNFSTRKNTVDINTFRSPKEPDPQDEVSKDEHQVPLRQAGHLVETLKKMFSDSTTAPQISKPAPRFEGTAVVNGEFKELKLGDYKGKYLVLVFYPLDFTFVCPTEIIAFSDRISEFKEINTEVVAISVDSQFTHLAWINTPRKQGGLGPIAIPLLSDLTHQISKDYGVLLEDLGHTLRGLFIIDGSGVLRQITMNDLPVGRSVDETLRLVQAFQYTDKNGEVCPAGWKPGSDTIIPNPEDKLKYFSKQNDQ